MFDIVFYYNGKDINISQQTPEQWKAGGLSGRPPLWAASTRIPGRSQPFSRWGDTRKLIQHLCHIQGSSRGPDYFHLLCCGLCCTAVESAWVSAKAPDIYLSLQKSTQLLISNRGAEGRSDCRLKVAKVRERHINRIKINKNPSGYISIRSIQT